MLSVGSSWGPTHYVASHGITEEASDCACSMLTEIVTSLCPLSTLVIYSYDLLDCMSELSIRYYNILFILCDNHRKMRF